MLVVDASVLAPAVTDGGDDGDVFRRRLRGEQLIGPDLLRIEVLSVIRRLHQMRIINTRQAGAAVDDLVDLPLTVYPTDALLGRAWELRDDVTPYDACYVALAEALGCPLVTADARLAGAPGTRCRIELL